MSDTVGQVVRASVMRNMLSTVVVVLIVLIIAVGVVGYYREWFHFGRTADPETGQTEFKLSVDQKKVQGDIEKARHQVTPAKTEVESH
jgi:hypothetical protein